MAISQDQRLRIDLSKYEKLNREQAGHLRHFHNLVDQIDGEWYGMGSQQDAHQEFLDAYRYQLAQMSYGAAVAHYHRLPAARSIFKPLLRRIIHKMLRPEVWGYWYLTSQSGKFVDPDITELRKPWADPVATENIMYSGHLLLMTSLYAMLFDDDEFEKPGSITFTWAPIFWGFGPETYRYDNRSLQTVIVEQMERNNWVGVCCEPNSVFVVCNQFPARNLSFARVASFCVPADLSQIIAMRYNDVRDGVDTVSHVLEKYKKAIADHGLLRRDGLYAEWLYLKQGRVEPPKGVTSVAWQALGFIMSINGEFRLQDPAVALEYRKLAQTEKPAGCDETAMLEKARVEAAKLPPNPFPLTAPYLGYVVQWLSELGKEKELEDLLEYADSRLLPTWEKGGLFYPRNNTTVNGNGDWVHMDPFTGNAAIGYARLNVKDGQKIMWEKPWTHETLVSRPWIDEVSLSQGVDCLRACWDDEEKMLVLTLRAWDNGSVKVQPVARNLSAGSWGVYVQGKLIRQDVVEDGGSLSVDVGVSNEDLDIVFLRI